MNLSKLVGAVAKGAIATMAGGPIAGGAATASAAVDIFVGWLGREQTPTLKSTMARVERGLEELARSERIDEEQVEQAITQAEAIVLAHGPSAPAIIALDLSADRVVAGILSQAARELADLDEPARELCRKTIRVVYTTMLADPQTMPELQRAFQQATLTRLTELRSQPQEILLGLQQILAATAVVDHRRQWRPDLYPPSALLRAEFEIVPFYGRERALDELQTWAVSGRPGSIRTYTGAGGMGKTRLMLEVCGRLGGQGWRAGFLNRSASGDWLLPLNALFEVDQSVFIVIDYAETRVREVMACVERLINRPDGRAIRIVLLARALGDWWASLTSTGGGIGDILAGPATSVVALQPLASDIEQRRLLFERAARAFQHIVPGSHVARVPGLDASYYDRALYILIAALAAVQGAAIERDDALLDWAYSRERDFLDDGVESIGVGQLKGRPIRQCAAVATLVGRAMDRPAAIALLSSSAPLMKGQPAAVVDAVAELLHRLYPGEAWLQGVLPDILGEHLVEQATYEDRDLLQAVFGHGQ